MSTHRRGDASSSPETRGATSTLVIPHRPLDEKRHSSKMVSVFVVVNPADKELWSSGNLLLCFIEHLSVMTFRVYVYCDVTGYSFTSVILRRSLSCTSAAFSLLQTLLK